MRLKAASYMAHGDEEGEEDADEDTEEYAHDDDPERTFHEDEEYYSTEEAKFYITLAACGPDGEPYEGAVKSYWWRVNEPMWTMVNTFRQD